MCVNKNFKHKNISPIWVLFAFSMVISCSEKVDPNLDEEELPEIVLDIDGNEYNVVKIQGVKWLHQNLKTSRYRDGSPIQEIKDNITWKNIESGAYSWFKNSNRGKEGYGKLYNWKAATCCEICPEGFRVPTEDDFNKIRIFLGEYFCDELDCPPYLTWILKSGTREGMRLSSGEFLNTEFHTGFWSSQISSENEVIIYELIGNTTSTENFYSGRFLKSTAHISTGLSIKCVEEM